MNWNITAGRPVYVQLVEQLELALVAGEFPPGSRIPPVRELAARPGNLGFLLPAMEKSQLFRGVIADGILPRKTFSMGHSREKRYYLEGRKIK